MIDVTELEKEYAFDMEGFGTEKREGNPRLVKIGSSDYNYANDNNWVVSISSLFMSIILASNLFQFKLYHLPKMEGRFMK